MSRTAIIAAASLAAFAATLPGAAVADGKDDDDRVRARLVGFQEVPSVSTVARGSFEAKLASDSIAFELRYDRLEGTVTQAHIHFAQKGVNGGIMVFLCSNLGNGPAGTQPCPTPSGTVIGTLTAASVIGGAAAQGIAPGQFDEVLRAIRGGVAYVNVHSNLWPGGEIRGQLKAHD